MIDLQFYFCFLNHSHTCTYDKEFPDFIFITAIRFYLDLTVYSIVLWELLFNLTPRPIFLDRGVPQGSTLGPFILFLDLGCVFKSHCFFLLLGDQQNSTFTLHDSEVMWHMEPGKVSSRPSRVHLCMPATSEGRSQPATSPASTFLFISSIKLQSGLSLVSPNYLWL